MKIIFSLVFALSALTIIAQPYNYDRAIQEKLSKLNQLSRSGQISQLSFTDKEYINDLLIQAIDVVDGFEPVPTPIPFPSPFPNQFNILNKVVAYQSDNCTNAVTELRFGDNCSSLSGILGNQRVWSVGINGKCIDIQDTYFASSCPSLVALASSSAPKYKDLEVYSDDACQVNVTTIDPAVNCSALGRVLERIRVWSVRLDGACVDISDTNMSANLCQGYQDAVLASYEADRVTRRSGEEVEFFANDNCSAKVARIVKGTNCNAMSKIFDVHRVWSIRFRGSCVDIADTNFQAACNAYTR